MNKLRKKENNRLGVVCVGKKNAPTPTKTSIHIRPCCDFSTACVSKTSSEIPTWWTVKSPSQVSCGHKHQAQGEEPTPETLPPPLPLCFAVTIVNLAKRGVCFRLTRRHWKRKLSIPMANLRQLLHRLLTELANRRYRRTTRIRITAKRAYLNKLRMSLQKTTDHCLFCRWRAIHKIWERRASHGAPRNAGEIENKDVKTHRSRRLSHGLWLWSCVWKS